MLRHASDHGMYAHESIRREAVIERKGKEQDGMSADPAFDRWVSRQLHKAYDEVLLEDVPAELLGLVESWPQPNGDKPQGASAGSAGGDVDRAAAAEAAPRTKRP